IRGPAGLATPDFTRLGLGLVLCSDATVADDESIIGDPPEAALVVLADKVGVDAEETRRTLPRRAEVPFDSEYKFMATFHDRPDWLSGGILRQPHFVSVKGAPRVGGGGRRRAGRSGGILRQPHFVSVKGAPDVVVERCRLALWHGELVPIDTVRGEIL